MPIFCKGGQHKYFPALGRVLYEFSLRNKKKNKERDYVWLCYIER